MSFFNSCTDEIICKNESIDRAMLSLLRPEFLDRFFFGDSGCRKYPVEVPYNKIFGTTRSDVQSGWEISSELSCVYTGNGTEDTKALIKQVNRASLSAGWPTPTPEDNFISVKRIEFLGSDLYFICGNGNSRVSASWTVFRSQPELMNGYVFFCKVIDANPHNDFELLLSELKKLKQNHEDIMNVNIKLSNQEYLISYIINGDEEEIKLPSTL